ncbi:MAG: FG-GAP repeat domain-containing protein [Acidobacteriota bacterium]
MKNLSVAIVVLVLAACSGSRDPEWAVPNLPYRLLVEIAPLDMEARPSDSMPASLDLDFSKPPLAELELPEGMDLDSIQVMGYDPTTGKPLQAPAWPFQRHPAEYASRFLDKSLPWDFPLSEPRGAGQTPVTFRRGAFLNNVRMEGRQGVLTWDHLQAGPGRSAHYAIYFDRAEPGSKGKIPRQGFIGDGSPRRDVEDGSLTGSLYNRVAVTDWDGDGLQDLLVGIGFGQILLYRNEGDARKPRYTVGEYLRNAKGEILYPGPMCAPDVADWNGDGVEDLVVGVETRESVVWYENTGSNTDRKLVYRGYVKADGKDIVAPPKPNPESPHYQKDYAPGVDVVDWDGDADVDLLLGGYITGYVWLYENTGNGADGTPTLVFKGPLQADGRPIDTIWGAHPCAADLDGDGDLDLLSGSFGQRMGGGDSVSEFLLLYENVGSRKAPRLTGRPVPWEGQPPQDILAQARAVDFNQDGTTDLVISTVSRLYLATHVGTRLEPRWKLDLQKATWGLSPLSMTQMIDLNGDGHADLIQSPLDGSGAPQVMFNQGKGAHGVFSSPAPLLPAGQEISHPAPYGDPWAFVYLHDFEGDGDLDILWADGPGNAFLHWNNGTREKPSYDTRGEILKTAAGKPIKVGPPVVPREKITDFTVMQGSRAGIAAADFDRDGKTDIAIGDTYGDVYYFANTTGSRQPVFSEPIKLGNVSNRATPLPYDWDHDGKLDILGIAWGGRMEWYRNSGQTGLSPFEAGRKLELPPTVRYSPRMVVADWNRDGDDDCLIMSSYPWFCWLEASYIRHGYAKARITKVETRD